MSKNIVFIFFILSLLTMCAIIIAVSSFWGRRRIRALKALAGSLNFSFSEHGSEDLLTSLTGFFQLFSRGADRIISNVMQRTTDEADVTILDYKFFWHHDYRLTVMLFRSSKLRLPYFIVRPQHVFTRLKRSLFGSQNIDLHAYPTFSKRYILQGNSEEMVRVLFNMEVVQYYVEVVQYYDRYELYVTEGLLDILIFYKFEIRISPRDIHGFMEEGFRRFGLFKSRTKDLLL